MLERRAHVEPQPGPVVLLGVRRPGRAARGRPATGRRDRRTSSSAAAPRRSAGTGRSRIRSISRARAAAAVGPAALTCRSRPSRSRTRVSATTRPPCAAGVDRAVGADRGTGPAAAHQPARRGCRSASSASMLGEPGVDLADPEPQLTADPEPARAAALAAQVVEGLDADPELGGQLRQGEDGSSAVGGRAIGSGARGGLHAAQVRQPCRTGPSGPRRRRGPRPVRRLCADFC